MFGKVLRNLIENKYKSQAKFAEECSISTGYLNDLLSGRTLPKNQKLEIIINKLRPLSIEDEKLLLREWAFDKSDGILRKDFEEIEEKNKDMLEVLKTMRKEKDLLEEVAQLKEYESFYNLFFKDLSSEETKTVLKAMVKELKVMSIDSPKKELLKGKFEKLDEIINKI